MDTNLSIATIRSLGIDMINKAKSGHPGMVLGSAPALYTLFTKQLAVNPQLPDWQNRDRFVLASGHASALLYSLLHLSGYDLSIEDLKQFRQWRSKTPGHPEYKLTPGVDAASGPLGQGIPMAIGMAMAEKFLAEKFNKEDLQIVDHYTYALCGDGDMQEGVTYEASSLAGHLSLGKLIIIYDANDVTLDGPLSYSFSENVKQRYLAMNWQVIEVADGNDTNSLAKALKKAKKEIYKPTIIIMKTIIGYGSSNQGTNKVHGNPLGDKDGKQTKLNYHFDYENFYVPDEVYNDFKKNVFNRGKRQYKKWVTLLEQYKNTYPNDYESYKKAINGEYHLDYSELLSEYDISSCEATRDTSRKVIQYTAKQNPTFLSGTADLASSTKTLIDGEDRYSPENYQGRNLYFGIREFAMVSIMNGLTLHKGIKVSAGGFLVFSDYFKPALRMACLMKLPIILPLSHDSIAVGEDGSTHQPVEQLAMLRSMVNMHVFRPADANELMACWKIALETKDSPSALILTRQKVDNITQATYEQVLTGAYVVSYEKETLDGIIIATGSEVSLALKAQKELYYKGKDVRIVSMPCNELFDLQSDDYKESVLPSQCRRRLSVEMASDFGWSKYVGLDGLSLSVNTFGASAPADIIIKNYGFTVENVVNTYLKLK
ncbi:transketolase [Eggerthia catenaformis OT 569 = DSM 20559]|uniref:Transketolase n=1 Tax=Eggerthia catenaformis OT 569 = DSM 20559 TaxID=999415 RepID=M2NFQ3_9FIRM|nr:transketolase [Eggerthia catenaformis]EMD17023.1 transketolase [Eggerthia catenaformis OT 569 = DSM 20559]